MWRMNIYSLAGWASVHRLSASSAFIGFYLRFGNTKGTENFEGHEKDSLVIIAIIAIIHCRLSGLNG